MGDDTKKVWSGKLVFHSRNGWQVEHDGWHATGHDIFSWAAERQGKKLTYGPPRVRVTVEILEDADERLTSRTASPDAGAK